MVSKISVLAVLIPAFLVGCGPEALDSGLEESDDPQAAQDGEVEDINEDLDEGTEPEERPYGMAVGTCVVDTFSLQSRATGVKAYTSARWSEDRGLMEKSAVSYEKELLPFSKRWAADSWDDCVQDAQRVMGHALQELCAAWSPEQVDGLDVDHGHVVAQVGYVGEDTFRWYNRIEDGRFLVPILADAMAPTTVFSCATNEWGYEGI